MIKHTWPEHSDYENLKKALGKMEEVANFINEKKREAELIQKVVDLDKRISNKIEGFVDPFRKFIKEGIVAGLFFIFIMRLFFVILIFFWLYFVIEQLLKKIKNQSIGYCFCSLIKFC